MRELKKYALRELPLDDAPKFGKRTQAVFDVLRSAGPKTAREIQAMLGKYTLGGIGAALSEIRKAGMLEEIK